MPSERLGRALAALLDAIERGPVPPEVEKLARRVRAILEAERRPEWHLDLPPIETEPGSYVP